MEPIARLSEEHDRLLALSTRIRAALREGDEATAAVWFDELAAVLEPHAEAEECGLFRSLAADPDLNGIVPGLLADHARLHRPVEMSGRRLVAFLDDLAAHIRLEEHDVFPAATQLLPADAWDDVIRQTRPAGGAAAAGSRPGGGRGG
jgi:hemerythrin-like domain-containing protein